MRNLLMTIVFCGLAQLGWASTDCPSTTIAAAHERPAAELISSAAAQPGTSAAEPEAVMLPASVHGNPTQVMGGPPGPAPVMSEAPRHGSKLQLVLASLGLMLVIVLRRLAAAD